MKNKEKGGGMKEENERTRNKTEQIKAEEKCFVSPAGVNVHLKLWQYYDYDL
jgi:hypothetical protein